MGKDLLLLLSLVPMPGIRGYMVLLIHFLRKTKDFSNQISPSKMYTLSADFRQ